LPAWIMARSISRSSDVSVMRYRTFMMAPFRTIDHGNVTLSILKSTPRFTEKQGQYLAFIYTYALVNRRPPAEADMQAFFGVTPPSVHRMVMELEKLGLIRRTPRQARSIEVCLSDDEIPRLVPQPFHSSVSRY
jgi:DNA-binding MarR family transcriptional regulator